MAEIAETAPRRLVRKIDATPDLAEGWTWRLGAENTTVKTDKGEVVTLRASRLRRIEELSCTCLLSPRCLHVLAVASALELDADADGASEPPTEAEGAERGEDPGAFEIRPDQIEAATSAYEAASDILIAGGDASGSLTQAELLRAVHSCRVVGLHRVSRAGVKVVRSLRDLRGSQPEFRLTSLAADLDDLLSSAHGLAEGGVASQASLGTARRRYSPLGNLRLHGVFSEPVVARSGYAGVTTYLCDNSGRLHTFSDVTPGEPGQASSTYQRGEFAGAALGHDALCRSGLFVNGATGSPDSRLGRGKGVKAVRASGASFDEAPLAGLWSENLEAQLERHRRLSELPLEERPAGWDLLFLEATVIGAREDALLLRSGEAVFEGLAPHHHEALAYRDNLRQLASISGAPIRLVARLLLDRSRAVALLAASSPALSLPDEWSGRVNLGLDRLGGANFREETLAAPRCPPLSRESDPLRALRRRLERVALAGRASLPLAAFEEVQRDSRALARGMMPTGSALLQELSEAAQAMERGHRGERHALTRPFADAWMRGMLYERAARAELVRSSWVDPRHSAEQHQG